MRDASIPTTSRSMRYDLSFNPLLDQLSDKSIERLPHPNRLSHHRPRLLRRWVILLSQPDRAHLRCPKLSPQAPTLPSNLHPVRLLLARASSNRRRYGIDRNASGQESAARESRHASGFVLPGVHIAHLHYPLFRLRSEDMESCEGERCLRCFGSYACEVEGE